MCLPLKRMKNTEVLLTQLVGSPRGNIQLVDFSRMFSVPKLGIKFRLVIDLPIIQKDDLQKGVKYKGYYSMRILIDLSATFDTMDSFSSLSDTSLPRSM